MSQQISPQLLSTTTSAYKLTCFSAISILSAAGKCCGMMTCKFVIITSYLESACASYWAYSYGHKQLHVHKISDIELEQTIRPVKYSRPSVSCCICVQCVMNEGGSDAQAPPIPAKSPGTKRSAKGKLPPPPPPRKSSIPRGNWFNIRMCQQKT